MSHCEMLVWVSTGEVLKMLESAAEGEGFVVKNMSYYRITNSGRRWSVLVIIAKPDVGKSGQWVAQALAWLIT